MKDWIWKQRKRLRRWKDWRKYTNLGLFTQICILFGWKRSSSFDAFMTIEDYTYFNELNGSDLRDIKKSVKQIKKEEKHKNGDHSKAQ